MYKHIYQKRIRYGETDQMGYLYYGNYPALYEIGRAEAIRDLGTTYKSMEESHGIMMPVIEIGARYLRPAYYDDFVSIVTYLKEMPDKLIHFEHEIYNASDELLNKGFVKLFFIDQSSGKRISCPEYLKVLLRPYFG